MDIARQNSRKQKEMVNPFQGVLYESHYKKRVVDFILLLTVLFQLINLPAAVLAKSALAFPLVFTTLTLCGLAITFNHFGRKMLVCCLLMIIINLSCNLMLLTIPGGLDVGNLPLFDMLIASELIAVSLLPAENVFFVALLNILFILASIELQPHTDALDHLLKSGAGYAVLVHPLSLQILVAVVTYLWVRSSQLALTRANRAEEIAALRQREVENKQRLDREIEQLSRVLTRVANGDHAVRVNLSQDATFWQLESSFNLLLARLARSSQIEQENQQLHTHLSRLSDRNEKTCLPGFEH